MFGMARHAVGQCKVAMGDAPGGILDMREAARIEPDEVAHHADLAATLRTAGDIEGALAAGPCSRCPFSALNFSLS